VPTKRSASIQLLTLGQSAILTRNTKLEPTAEVAFAAALYLILERGETIWRRQLQDLLWPKVSTSVRAHRLRQTLLKLRQVGIAIATPSLSQIALTDSDIIVDYEAFVRGADPTRHDANQSLAVLPGYEPRFSAPFMEWMDAKREEIESAVSRVLCDIIARARSQGDWLEVEKHASRLIRFQQRDKDAMLALAEALAMRAARSEALVVLQRLRRELADAGLPDEEAVQMQKQIAEGADPRSNRFLDTQLVGRGGAIRDLLCALDQAKANRGGAIIVWGEPGVGKTRLLAEFTTVAGIRGVAVKRVDCKQTNCVRPLSVFQDLVPQLQRLPGAIGCAPESLAHLKRLTNQRHEPAEFGVEDPDVILANIRRSIFDLLDAVGDEQAVIVWIEDSHWIDDKSAALLVEILRWAGDRQLLFVMSSREEPGKWIGESPNIAAILLNPLADCEAREIVEGVVRSFRREMSPSYVDWCTKVADGNPYFLQELANQWLEVGEQERLPASLAAVLEERIGRLSKQTLHVLQCCALVEGNSTFGRLERILEYPAHTLLECVNALGTAGMILLENRSSATTALLRSRHILLSTAAIARLTPAALAYLHRRIGLVLESEIDRNSSTALLWDCAHHWRESGDSARALELAQSCANRLMALGLPSEAASAYNRALAFCRTDPDRLSMLGMEARASYAANDWDKVGELVPVIHELKRRALPIQSTHDDNELMYLRAEWRKLRWNRSLIRALKCVAATDATPSHRVQAGYSALILLHSICDHPRMHQTFDLLRDLAVQADVERVNWLEVSMVYHTSCGDLPTAVQAAAELIVLRRESGNIGETFRALCNGAITFRVAGQFEETEKALMEAVNIALEHRIHPALHRVYPTLANFALERGNLEDAERSLAEMRRYPVPDSDKFTPLEIRAVAVRIALLRGRFDEALSLLPKQVSEVRSETIVQRRVHLAALIVATQLAIAGKADAEFLNILVETHLLARRNAHQAFEAYVTFLGLRAAGQGALAEMLLAEYLTTHRREPWPPSLKILQSLQVASAS